MTLAEFFTVKRRYIMGMVVKYHLSPESSEDIYQELYLAMSRVTMTGHTFDDYRRAAWGVLHWTVLRHYQSQQGRMGSPKQQTIMEPFTDAPDNRRCRATERRDLWDVVKPLCQGLSKPHRLVVILRYMEEMDGAEISRHFGQDRRIWAPQVLRDIRNAYRKRHESTNTGEAP